MITNNRIRFTLFICLLTGSLWSAPSFKSSLSLQPNPNPSAPLAGVLSFKTSKPVTTKIIGSTEGHRFELSYGPDRNPSNGLPVVGMRADKTYTVTVHISDSTGQTTYQSPLSIATPPLPNQPHLMPRIETKAILPERMQTGFTLFNPRRVIPQAVENAKSEASTFNSSFGMLAVVDDEGEVIWYYHTDSRITDYRPISNGNIVFITSDNRLIEIDSLGNTVASWVAKHRPDGPSTDGSIPVDAQTFHHSFQEYPNGDFLILSTEIRELPNYYTSETDVNAPRKTQRVVGDVVMRMTRKGKILWKWKAFDHLDPYKIGYLTFSYYWVRRGLEDTVDWSHANAVRIVDDGDSFLVNFRMISGIAKIGEQSQEIEWMAISKPEDMDEKLKGKTFSLKGGNEWFWMPHAPWITDQGTLLIFNNDNFGSRPFGEAKPPRAIRTRAEEYELDEENRTLKKIWESRFPGEEPLRSWAMGSVQPLPNGNIFVGYGFLFVNEGIEDLTWKNRLLHPGWTQIREYTRDTPSSLVWNLTLHPLTEDTEIGWSIYGGLRIPSWPATGYRE